MTQFPYKTKQNSNNREKGKQTKTSKPNSACFCPKPKIDLHPGNSPDLGSHVYAVSVWVMLLMSATDAVSFSLEFCFISAWISEIECLWLANKNHVVHHSDIVINIYSPPIIQSCLTPSVCVLKFCSHLHSEMRLWHRLWLSGPHPLIF